jgi:hypothetical protein
MITMPLAIFPPDDVLAILTQTTRCGGLLRLLSSARRREQMALVLNSMILFSPSVVK